ncbi:hypothetical protein DTO166G4_5139 [Paecilomyces variotii]|nr:hypothetical protein DTO166G4_5139 [Paecilomyces variotii]KAJ9229344.1 hypothetical protein DTO166G5_7926 [Paecilomyces variotii]KAJ9366672.1 hypothetical protein DTO282E5_8627 [Paecilomyces variotii]KAJ9395284.1 hypothetical protein DTO282F9_7840 [Paecilomyces variotii]
MSDSLRDPGNRGPSSFEPDKPTGIEDVRTPTLDSKDYSPRTQNDLDSRQANSTVDFQDTQSLSSSSSSPPWHKDSISPGTELQRKRKRSLTTDNLAKPLLTDHMDADHEDPTTLHSMPNVKRAKTGETVAMPERNSIPVDKSKLPKELWQHIFTFLPPATLGVLLRVNKAFNSYLTCSETDFSNTPRSTGLLRFQTQDSIWSISRKTFVPGMPRPLIDKTELEMWRLTRGLSCQFCGKSRIPTQPESSPWESGPGPDGVRIIWPFGIRSCGDCFSARTEKELDVMLSSLPTFLIPALPFALVTSTLHFVPSVTLRSTPVPPSAAITKYYFKPHIDRLKLKFEDVKSLGPAVVEEWIKGLDSEGKEHLADSSRWEQWEANGGLRAVQEGGSLLGSRRPRTTSPAKFDNTVPSSAEPRQTGLSNGKWTSSERSPAASAARYGSILPPRPFSPQVQQGHHFQPRMERNLRDINEAKAARRAEIERRCAEMDPPLTPSVLSHMESFLAAIQIPHPFTDRDWEILKPRLMTQREAAERKEEQRLRQSQLLQARSEERRQQEAHLKEAKEMLDREWEDVQRPIRDRMAMYADEIINEGWRGGSAVTKEKSPKFAADVLMYVRNKFYGHIEEEDAIARASGKPVELDPPNAPPRRKLILENMKWIFDTKVKPFTEQFQKELFICNGCENNSKFYGFEGVIQHYAAKHTNSLSLGSVVVHWRSEWPEKPPFHPNPSAAKALFMAMGQNSGFPGHQKPSGMFVPGTDQGHPIHPDTPSIYPHQSPGPYGPHPYTPYPYAHGPFRPPSPNISHYYPGSPPAYGYPAPQTGFPAGAPYEQPVPPPTVYGSPYIRHAYPVYQRPDHHVAPYATQPYGPPPQYVPPYQNSSRPPKRNGQFHHYNSPAHSFGPYQDQADEMARTAREVWNRTSGIKDLPNSVRAHVLMYHVITAFREQFQGDPPVALFADCLNNHPQMRPIRNLGGLACRACIRGEVSGGFQQPEAGNDARLYTLPALVSHFQSSHGEAAKPSIIPQTGVEVLRPDWKYDMIELPDASAVALLLQAPGVDGAKLQLVADAFPGVFSKRPASREIVHARYQAPSPRAKAHTDAREAKRHCRGLSVSTYDNLVADSEERRREVPSNLSSPRRRDLELVVSRVQRGIESPIRDSARPSRPSRDDEYYPRRPSSIEPSRLAYESMGNRPPASPLHRQVIMHGPSHGYSSSRDYDDKSSRGTPASRNQDMEEPDRNDLRSHTSTVDRSRHILADATSPRLSRHREHSAKLEYRNLDSEVLAPAHRQGSVRARTPGKDPEDEKIVDKLKAEKGPIDEAASTGRLSAAERFLESFFPEQETDTYQPDDSEAQPRIETSPGPQWRQAEMEPRQYRYGPSADRPGEKNPRGIRGRNAASNGWPRRKRTPPAGSYDYEARYDSRSSRGPPPRFYNGRSPDQADSRQGRRTASHQESKRPHSRFDRYEAQRQGSLRPRSKSPAIRDRVPAEVSYYDEGRPQVQSRDVYQGHTPDAYYERSRVEELAYTTAQRGRYHYIEEPRSVETQYDNPVEYVPVRVAAREPGDSGTYFVERTAQASIPKDYTSYDIEASRQPVCDGQVQSYHSLAQSHVLGERNAVRLDGSLR